jgi:2-methylcitrate dehydratase PrpD
MAQRVGYRIEPGLRKTQVGIRLRGGQAYEQVVTSIPGDPNNPVEQSAVEAKFRDCASFSFKRLDPERIERAIQLVADLESLDDATEIMRTLNPAIS